MTIDNCGFAFDELQLAFDKSQCRKIPRLVIAKRGRDLRFTAKSAGGFQCLKNLPNMLFVNKAFHVPIVRFTLKAQAVIFMCVSFNVSAAESVGCEVSGLVMET
jgi:hypothetical protein